MTVYGRRCSYCFVFLLLAPGTRHETGQQFKSKQGPEKGCAGCLNLLSLNPHILCGGCRISSCRGKRRREGYLRKRIVHTGLYALYLDSF
jgi:hypothetical protein